MNNFRQPGYTVELTAPAGGVVSGNAYQIGQLLVIANVSAAAGERFNGTTEGVFELPKAAGEVWPEGAVAYWDSGASEFTATAAGNLRAGAVVKAAAAPDTTGEIRLNGVAQPNEP